MRFFEERLSGHKKNLILIMEPQYFKTVDLASLTILPITKESKSYIARIEPRLVIQTPPIQVTSPLVCDGDHMPFVYLRVTGPFEKYLKETEEKVLNFCVAHKKDWLKRDLDDDAIRHCFKSFFKDDSIKVMVPEDVVVFDATKSTIDRDGLGNNVRAILELNRIVFGKTEFGAMWRVLQLQTVESPRCLIDDSLDTDEDYDDDYDMHEFL